MNSTIPNIGTTIGRIDKQHCFICGLPEPHSNSECLKTAKVQKTEELKELSFTQLHQALDRALDVRNLWMVELIEEEIQARKK